MLKVGVLVSGGGTNLQALLDAAGKGQLPGVEIAVVISSREGAMALERARKHGVPAFYIPRKEYADQASYDAALTRRLEDHGVGLVVLAGFASLLGPDFVRCFSGRIINIHPSLVPSFCGKGCYGLEPHRRALGKGVRVTGATVHFVDLNYDEGPIILQKPVAVKEEDTPETLQRRVMEEAEWILLPEAVRLFAAGRIRITDRGTTRILPESGDPESGEKIPQGEE